MATFLEPLPRLWHTAQESIPFMRLRLLADAFAFSSLLPAAIAWSLSWVASQTMDTPDAWHWASLAGIGTFIVYTLDRLRDVSRDRTTSPQRTLFIERNRRLLICGVGTSAIVFASLLWNAPPDVIGIAIASGVLGLLHRRLKNSTATKAFYVSLAWVGVCVGIPWTVAARPVDGLWAAAILFLILAANLVTSDLRDNESRFFPGRPVLILRVALLFAVLGAVLALVAPPRLAALAWIGWAEAVAILGFRPGERYGMLFLDGALWLGSGAATLHLVMTG